MMRITIKSFAALRELLGSPTLDLNVKDQATLFDAINELLSKKPILEQELLKDGNINPYYTFIVNDKKLMSDELKTHVLKSNDIVFILPPTGGGKLMIEI